MGQRAKDGTLATELVALALPLLRQAERNCPRTGRGDKPDIPDWLMAALIMVALLHKKKTKSAQFRFLQQRRTKLADCLGDERFVLVTRLLPRNPLFEAPASFRRDHPPTSMF